MNTFLPLDMIDVNDVHILHAQMFWFVKFPCHFHSPAERNQTSAANSQWHEMAHMWMTAMQVGMASLSEQIHIDKQVRNR